MDGAARYLRWAGLLVAAFLLLAPLVGDLYVTYLTTEILIFALFALAFNLVLGHAGLISFGHAAYFAMGAYACAILLTRLDWPLIASFPAAIAFTAVASAAIGAFCVRLTWIYFAMLTLAFAQLVWAVAFKWDDVTGGDTGLIGVSVPAFLETPTVFYYFTLTVVVVCTLLLRAIVNSAFGQIVVATRENPQRAEFIGVDVRRIRLAVFVISGTFSGVAGALFALFNRSVFSETAWWTQSAEVLIMTILGGMYSFIGPAVGAATLILLDRFITDYTEYWPTVLGIILLAVLFFAPSGLAGLAGAGPTRRAPKDSKDAKDTRAQQIVRRLSGHS